MRFKQHLITEIKAPKIYFGHPRATYNTVDEKRALQQIKTKWPDHYILNPNQGDRFEDKVQSMGFEIFYKLIDTCEFGAFMPFRDGKWGGGMFKEAQYCEKKNKPVFEVNPQKKEIKSVKTSSLTVLTPQETYNRIPNKDKSKYEPEE